MFKRENWVNSEDHIRFIRLVKIIAYAVLFFVGLVMIFGSFFSVDAGQRAILLRFGSVVRSTTEGLNLKFPIIERVVYYEVRTQKEQVESSAASKDLQTVKTVVAVNYNLEVEDIAAVYRTLGLEFKERIIDPAIQEAVKASTAQYTAEELITKREEVKNLIQKNLTERLSPNHVHVTEVSIVDFDFSTSFNAAIEAKVTAQQDALTAQNKLEQVKFEAEQKIAEARGSADARVLNAKAEAEAIKIQAQAITQQGGRDYVQLKAIEKWNGKLPEQMIPNATVPFLDLK